LTPAWSRTTRPAGCSGPTRTIPAGISNAVLFPASDEARYITGVTLPAGAGFLAK
jgi:NAD(P)-dependent dehydrogenase (short-subunit alcohol dehydrogenase family)